MDAIELKDSFTRASNTIDELFLLKEKEDDAFGNYRPIVDYEIALKNINDELCLFLDVVSLLHREAELQLFTIEFNRFYKYVFLRHYKDYDPDYFVGRLPPNENSLSDNEKEWFLDAQPFLNTKFELYKILLKWRDEIQNVIESKELTISSTIRYDQLDTIYEPIVPRAKILILYDLLVDNSIIGALGFDNFVNCFDLTKQPLMRPTVKKINLFVLALMQIPDMTKEIAKRNFNIKNYTKEKSTINTTKTETDEFGGSALTKKPLLANKIAKWLK